MKTRCAYSRLFYKLFCVIFCFNVSTVYAEIDQRTEAANIAFKKARELKALDISIIQIRLALSQFEALDAEYNSVFEKYKTDPLYEQPLLKSYELFYKNNGISEKYLDRWVESTGSANANLAKAYYLLNEGYLARGNKLAGETTGDQFAVMKKLHAQAFDLLKRVIEINPYLMPAYSGLIRITQSSRYSLNEDQILALALTRDKRTYYVRSAYIHAMEPRWGGSLEKMYSAGQESAQYIGLNPKLWKLQGKVYAEAGLVTKDNDCDKAIELYTHALEYGDDMWSLRFRARCYKKKNEYQLSLNDYRKILYYIPGDKEAVKWVERLEKKL